MKKTGFVKIAGGAAMLLGGTVVVKSGLINMSSGKSRSVVIPNPMTRAQWNEVYGFWRHTTVFLSSVGNLFTMFG